MFFFVLRAIKCESFSTFYGKEPDETVSQNNSVVLKEKNYNIFNCQFQDISDMCIAATSSWNFKLFYSYCTFTNCGQCVQISGDCSVVQNKFCANNCRASNQQNYHFCFISSKGENNTNNIFEGSIVNCSPDEINKNVIKLEAGNIQINNINASHCHGEYLYYLAAESKVEHSIFEQNFANETNFYAVSQQVEQCSFIENSNNNNICKVIHPKGNFNGFRYSNSNFINDEYSIHFGGSYLIILTSCFVKNPHNINGCKIFMNSTKLNKIDFASVKCYIELSSKFVQTCFCQFKFFQLKRLRK